MAAWDPGAGMAAWDPGAHGCLGSWRAWLPGILARMDHGARVWIVSYTARAVDHKYN